MAKKQVVAWVQFQTWPNLQLMFFFWPLIAFTTTPSKVLSRLPKVENNHLHEIFTMIFIQLIFHFPLEMILPYLHGFFHFLGEINLSSPL
jgi:hypothetical protein